MNAELMAGVLTVVLLYGLILYKHYPVMSDWPRRRKQVKIPPTHRNQYWATRERLQLRLRARIGSRMQ